VTGAEYLLRVLREGLYLVVLVSAPAVIAALCVSFVVGLFQAASQIQEPTVALVPRLVAVGATLVVFGPWIGAQLVRFTRAVLEGFPQVGH
jgi:flagellar biosynthetic protein FliQ